MFCICCRPSGGFFAEGVAEPVIDFARALKRRTAYEQRTCYSRAGVSHPGQAEFVVRNVHAITMDPHIGNLGRTDIHVRDGVIVNISAGLSAPTALEIDGTGLSALPGLVASHRHPLSDALDIDARHSAAFGGAEAADIYRTMRLTLLDLISAGITSIHVCGADIGAGHAETAILAQIDSGARGRFSFPVSAEAMRDPQKAVRELYDTWFTEPIEHLLDLGLTGEQASLVPLIGSHQLPQTAAIGSDAGTNASLSERTIGAARQLGLDPWIGSLSPGKRADLILVRGERHTGFSVDDVALVTIDGKIRKRNGVLTEPNEGLIRREGAEAVVQLRDVMRTKAVELESK